MDFVKAQDVVRNMVAVGAAKAALPVGQLLVRGFLSGALLGFATSLAITATGQTQLPIVGALVFPVGFVMIVLLGLELVTGSFALVPLATMEGLISPLRTVSNLTWVFIGNLLGGLAYAWLLAMVYTQFHHVAPTGPAAAIIAAAEAKTLAYQKLGMAGWWLAFVKAVLCNWMVCMGVVMAMTSHSTIGKIAAMWLPILTFFGQGFEHSVVNMFLIPCGMLMGAHVSMRQWWLWNQIPVTLGNLVGGFVFTGLALYVAYGRKPALVLVEQVTLVEVAGD